MATPDPPPFQWLKWLYNPKGDTNGSAKGFFITTDSLGNIYVSGNAYFADEFFYDSLRTIGTTFQFGTGFVMKCSPTGDLLWISWIDGENGDDAYGLSVDSSFQVYVSGTISGGPSAPKRTFRIGKVGNFFSIDVTFEDNYNTAAFLIKLNQNGDFTWVNFLNAKTYDYSDIGHGISQDAVGNIVLAYMSGGEAGGNNLNIVYADRTQFMSSIQDRTGQSGNRNGFKVIYAVRFSPTGSFLSIIGLRSYTLDYGEQPALQIITDSNNATYVASHANTLTGNDTNFQSVGVVLPIRLNRRWGFLAKFTPQNAYQWSTWLTDPTQRTETECRSVVQINNDFYVTGFSYISSISAAIQYHTPTSSNIQYITKPSTFLNRAALFVMKLNTSGQYQWSKWLAASTGDVRGLNIQTDTMSNLYITGTTTVRQNRLFLNTSTIVKPLTSTGQASFFLKLGSDGEYKWMKWLYGRQQNSNTVSYNSHVRSNAIYTTGYTEDIQSSFYQNSTYLEKPVISGKALMFLTKYSFQPPNSVTGLLTDGVARLNWTPINQNLTYQVYISTQSVEWQLYDTTLTSTLYPNLSTKTDRYYFQVVATDADGLVSDPSPIQTIDAIRNPTVGQPDINRQVNVQWSTIQMVSTYTVFRDGSIPTIVESNSFQNTLSQFDVDQRIPVAYQVTTTSDGTGKSGYGFLFYPMYDIQQITTSNAIQLSWGSNMTYVSSYMIYKSSIFLASVTDTSYIDYAIETNSTYKYSLEAVYNTGIYVGSGPSTLLELTYMPILSTLSGFNSSFGIYLTWTTNPVADSYSLYKNESLYQTLPVNTYYDEETNLVPFEEVRYRVTSKKGISESPLSQILIFEYIPKVQFPQITNELTGVKLRWTPFLQNGVSYQISRSTPTTVVTVNEFEYTDTSVIAGSSYTYSLVAKYLSFDSEKTDIAIQYITAPVLTCINVAEGIFLEWNPVVSATSYIIRRNGQIVAQQADTTFVDTVPASLALVGFTYDIQATNSVSQSARSVPVSFAFVQPTTSMEITNKTNHIEISWIESPGNPEYGIFRNGYLYTTVTSSPFRDYDVYSGYSYMYSITVRQSGYESAQIQRPIIYISPPVQATSRISSLGLRLDWINGPTGPSAPVLPPAGYDGPTGTFGLTGPIGIDSYLIYKFTELAYSTTMSSFLDLAVNSGSFYKYTIQSRISSFTSALSTFTEKGYLAPPIPTTVFSISTISFSWPSVNGALGYNLYKSGMSFLSTSALTYLDVSQAYDNSTYSYSITSFDSVDESSKSEVSLRFLEPPRVHNLVSSIQLSMTGISGVEYLIYRDFVFYASSVLSTYVDSTVTNGVFYRYSYDLRGNSESNVPSAVSPIRHLQQIQQLNFENRIINNRNTTEVFWLPVPGATQYRIFVSNATFSTYTTNINVFLDIYVENDSKTSYQIQPVSGPFEGVVSQSFTNRYLTAPFVANVSTYVYLSWPHSSEASRYLLYRNDLSFPFSTISTNVSSFIDTTVVQNRSSPYVYYRTYISSLVEVSSSAQSSILYIAPPFSPQSRNEVSSIRISWQSLGNQFSVFRGGVFVSSLSTTTFYDFNVVHGDLYGHYVKEYSGPFESDSSSTLRTRYLTPIIASNVGSNVSLRLSTFTGLDSFVIYKNSSLFSSITLADSLLTNPILDDDVVSGNFYQYNYFVNGAGTVYTTSVDSILYHLGAPQGLTVIRSLDGLSLVLSWDSDPCCDSYRIYRNGIPIVRVSDTSFQDTSVRNGETYSYFIVSSRFGYESGPSNTVTLTFYQDPIIYNYGSRVRLDWLAIPDAEYYQISTSAWTTEFSTLLSTVSYKDSLVTSGSYYTYWILVKRPSDSNLISMGSNSIQFIAYPEVFQYTVWNTSNVGLQWPAIPGATQYGLFVSSLTQDVYYTTQTNFNYVMNTQNIVYSFQLQAYGVSSPSSKSNIHWILYQPPTRQFYPTLSWKQETSASMDISGVPTHIVGPDGNLYFVISTKGTYETLTTPYPVFGMTIGSMTPSGTIRWLFRHPNIFTGSGDGEPSLVFGESGEMYVAFVTTGNVPDRWNMSDVVNLCGTCGSLAGRKDIVVTRLDGGLIGEPTIQWRIQDANVNSCSDETVPHLVYDPYQRRILLTYQCVGSILCGNNICAQSTIARPWSCWRDPRVGSPTIVTSGFDLTGKRLWTYQDHTINGPGQNTAPKACADTVGNIYVSYMTTQPTYGASTIVGMTSVEVVKFHAEQPFPPWATIGVRDWVLSSKTQLNIIGQYHSDPYILFDPIRKQIYLAYCVSPVVNSPGRIVFVCIDTEGNQRWFKNNDIFNQQCAGKVLRNPILTLDSAGTLYAAVSASYQGISESILFRINTVSGDSLWQILNFFTPNTAPTLLNTYTPMSTLTEQYPSVVYTSADSFSPPSLASVSVGNLTLGIYREPNQFHILSFSPIQQYTYPTSGTIVVSYP
jgi:hypothetical protein